MSACRFIDGVIFTLRETLDRGPEITRVRGELLDELGLEPVDPELTHARLAFGVNMAVNTLLVSARVIPRPEAPKSLVGRGLTPRRLNELEVGLVAFRDELFIQGFESKTKQGTFRDTFATSLRNASQTRIDALASMLRSARDYLTSPNAGSAMATGNALGVFLQYNTVEESLAWVRMLTEYPEVPDA